MRYLALACDYDGTVAWNGQVDPPTIVALRRARENGRKLILVTGRELDELIDRFPDVNLFDRVVAENGAVIYCPETDDQRLLGDPPPPEFIRDLRQRGVSPVSVGDVIVATWHPHEAEVLDIIEKYGLDHHVIFNKGAVMILPAGIDKAAGLVAALHELRLSPRNCICIGDAENDQSMFRVCELSVAVDNALATLKANADMVTRGHHGAGVVELIDELVTGDLVARVPRPQHHTVVLGHREGADPVCLPVYDSRVLLIGASGSGKSTLASAVLEQLLTHGYQVCVIDPEGDYGTIPDIIPVGDSQRWPTAAEVIQLLEHPSHSLVVNLFGMPFSERPAFLSELCPRLRELRKRTGRPHWLIVDEAHHLLPDWASTACQDLWSSLPGLLLITVDPRHVLHRELEAATLVITVDPQPSECLRAFADATGRPVPEATPCSLRIGEGLAWYPDREAPPIRFQTRPCRSMHRRHRRKYAEGDMGPERSFYFRGPDDRYNMPARNLIAFLDLGDSLDGEAWLYHAHRGDFSRWISGAVGDHELAERIAAVEKEQELSAEESRRRVRETIEQRYTLPV